MKGLLIALCGLGACTGAWAQSDLAALTHKCSTAPYASPQAKYKSYMARWGRKWDRGVARASLVDACWAKYIGGSRDLLYRAGLTDEDIARDDPATLAEIINRNLAAHPPQDSTPSAYYGVLMCIQYNPCRLVKIGGVLPSKDACEQFIANTLGGLNIYRCVPVDYAQEQ